MEKCDFEYGEALAERIRELAAKYETHDFILEDPSKFMHRYSNACDKEIVALLAAALAFGKRSEILSHIEKLLEYMDGESPMQWILEGKYEGIIPDSCKSFYRIFTYKSILLAFRTIKVILENYGSLGRCLELDYMNGECRRHKGRMASVIGTHFPDECSPLISKGEDSANKRLNLFLRWMARDNSPVDLGLWTWYPKTELLMPLDTHVVAMAKAFGFLSAKGDATLNQAIKLTDIMRRFFPDDPVKGDFALFGYGIEQG